MKREDIELDGWQKDCLEHDGNLLLCTGRQVGKTLIFAMKASEYLVNHPKTQIIAVSLTEDQAFLMRAMVEEYLKDNYPHMLKVAKKLKPTKNKIHLKNGSTYIVRPVGATGDSIRGYTANVLIVDEAAYMPTALWMASLPTLATTGGQIWMCSTPKGQQGYFYKCYENKENSYKVIAINTPEVYEQRKISNNWTAYKQERALEFLEDQKAALSNKEYAQEYLGQFIEDLQRLFSDELIEKACTEQPEQRLVGRNYYMGIDIARLGGDETSFSVIRRTHDKNYLHTYNETAQYKITTWTEQRTLELDRLYNFIRIYIDAGAGSLGVGILDHLLEEPQTSRKAIAVNNRKLSLTRDGKEKQRLLKEDLYDNLKSMMEKGRIKLLDDDKVRLSLRSIQYEYVIKADQPTKVRIFGNYSHIVESLMRACYASKEKIVKLDIHYM